MINDLIITNAKIPNFNVIYIALSLHQVGSDHNLVLSLSCNYLVRECMS